MSMVLSTILPPVCGWGDTCSVLVLHGIGSQYPPLIPEAGGGGQYSPPPLLMSRSPKPKYPTPLECSSQFMARNFNSTNSTLLASTRHVFCFLLLMDCVLMYALLLRGCLCFSVHLKLDFGSQDVWFTTYFDGSCCR